MILRPATPEDAPALATLGRESFRAAFAHLYRPEDLNAFLEEAYDQAVVAGEIADERYIHRLASDGTRLLGFVKMSAPSGYAEYSDAANPIALGQLYTDPAHTGEGIGAALMDWAMGEARTRGHDAIRRELLVCGHRHGQRRPRAALGIRSGSRPGSPRYGAVLVAAEWDGGATAGLKWRRPSTRTAVCGTAWPASSLVAGLRNPKQRPGSSEASEGSGKVTGGRTQKGPSPL